MDRLQHVGTIATHLTHRHAIRRSQLSTTSAKLHLHLHLHLFIRRRLLLVLRLVMGQ